MNPILPGTAFIPDGEPHVFEYNGELRVFVYGSRDETVTGYCGYGHDVWSAPVNDLMEWTNHGEIFNVKQVWDIGYGIVSGQIFGAPDCVYNPVTKKYYLYTFLGAEYKMDGIQGPLPGSDNYVPGFGNFGVKCLMAVSDNPAGPFTDPVMCDWPAANSAGSFDPSVLVDEQDDGTIRVYAFWGMYTCSIKGGRWAEIDPADMHTIINRDTRKTDRNAWHWTLDDPDENKGTILFEASSIKKLAKGKYALIYSAVEHYTALTYCFSSSPEGPWNYGGRIVDNSLNWKGGNNHGSIVEVNGKWYVFYHRATSDDFNRQAMIEPIEVITDEDRVIIPEVEMTSQGVQIGGLNAFCRYSANNASYLSQNAYIKGDERNPDGLNPIAGIDTDDTVIGYKYLNFGENEIKDTDELKLQLNIMMLRNTSITVKVSLPEKVNVPASWVDIVHFDLQEFMKNDGEYHDITIPVTGLDHNSGLKAIGGLKGKLAFFLSFSGKGDNQGGELCRLKEFELSKGDTATPNPQRDVIIEHESNDGMVTALPTRGKGGESVKLSVVTNEGYKLKSIVAADDSGNSIVLNRNCNAPYAPMNFNFKMPGASVLVRTRFEPDDLKKIKINGGVL